MKSKTKFLKIFLKLRKTKINKPYILGPNILKFCILFCLLIFTVSLFSQTKRLLKSHDNMKRLEQLDDKIKDERENTRKRIVPIKDLTIPIVFHVLYHNEVNKISSAQVLSQLEALNRDFADPPLTMEHPAIDKEKFRNKMDGMTIQFCFPQLNDDQKDLVGINYYQVANEEWDMDDAMKSEKNGGVDPWNTDKYLNVWVVNLSNHISGYAQLPGGPKAFDGIVIDTDFLGTIEKVTAPYNQGKTLTHLVGNYLGLHDLWGEFRCAGDLVFDTPTHNSPNYGCPEYKHFSTCTGEVEMTMNFMDNTDDECLQFFTIGQKYRLHSFLSPGGPRAQLLTTQTDCSTGQDSLELTENIPVEINQKAIRDIPNQHDIMVFPNPANEAVNIQYSLANNTTPFTIKITDSNGRLIYNLKNQVESKGSIKLDTRNWFAGIYLISFSQNNKIISTQKLMINKTN